MMTKRSLVSLLLIASVMVLVTITRVWVVVELQPNVASQSHVSIAGNEGIQALMPVAIALLAIAVVLTIAGRVFRSILGVLTALFGGWIAWASWQHVQQDERALTAFVAPAVTEATGLITDDTSALIAGFETSWWPIATLIAGVLVALVGVAISVFGWRWKQGGKKYETHTSKRAARTQVDRIADWDALSDGDDPSDWGENTQGR